MCPFEFRLDPDASHASSECLHVVHEDVRDYVHRIYQTRERVNMFALDGVDVSILIKLYGDVSILISP